MLYGLIPWTMMELKSTSEVRTLFTVSFGKFLSWKITIFIPPMRLSFSPSLPFYHSQFLSFYPCDDLRLSYPTSIQFNISQSFFPLISKFSNFHVFKIFSILCFLGAGVAFGPDRVRTFLDVNNLKMIVRSHECVPTGNQT